MKIEDDKSISTMPESTLRRNIQKYREMFYGRETRYPEAVAFANICIDECQRELERRGLPKE